MSKLLSVIVPTRNRQAYCLESIKSIITDLDTRCELIVQDNSSNDSLRSMIADLDSTIVTYNYNPAPLSFVDNFEEALTISTGKFFIILGDDDSTTKDIVRIVEYMDRENVESVSSSFVVDYIWPNENIVKYKTGHLSIPKYKGGSVDIDVMKSLDGLVKNGFLSYQTYNLPRTYHGIVKRSCMDEVKRRGGRYFGGLTPDIYSTVALACVVRNHKVIDFPFSIAGACPASATVNAQVGGHAGQLKDAPHFAHRGNYEWEPLIPRYYSVETIWAETAIKALKDMKCTDWVQNFDMYKLYIYGIYNNRKYILKEAATETVALHQILHISKGKHLLNLGFKFIRSFFKKISQSKQQNMHSNQLVIETVSDLAHCKHLVSEFLGPISNKW